MAQRSDPFAPADVARAALRREHRADDTGAGVVLERRGDLGRALARVLLEVREVVGRAPRVRRTTTQFAARRASCSSNSRISASLLSSIACRTSLGLLLGVL
jgi:hypothetical protein